MPSQFRRSGALLAAALVCAFAHGQDQSAPTPPAPTFELNANLVILDVVATDSQGNPVRGLKASDFTVLENRRPQPISIFQAHDYDVSENAGAQPIMPHLGPGVFTNYTPQPTNGAMNILLFDVLDTRMTDWEFARAQAEKEPSRPIGHTRLIISVPAKGDHFLRVGVRDPAANSIGALEVPLAEVNKPPAVEAGGAQENGRPGKDGQGNDR